MDWQNSVADPPEMSNETYEKTRNTVYQTKVMTNTPEDIEKEREAYTLFDNKIRTSFTYTYLIWQIGQLTKRVKALESQNDVPVASTNNNALCDPWRRK